MPELPTRPDRKRRPPEGPSSEEIRALTQEIAAEVGGVAYSNVEFQPSPVRTAGPEEWRLPDELDGRPFRKVTQNGPSWVRETPGSRPALIALGLTPRDLTVYGAFPAGSAHEAQGFHGVMAYQGTFADPTLAVAAFKRIFQAPDTVWEPISLGRLRVERGASREWGAPGTIYIWGDSTCIYQIVSSDEASARSLAEAITPFERDGQNDG